ncbi:MAG TPA: hypothetical protein VMB51_05330 [Solirubrobacteraceae bacterium]|nr:hypothetical protein [Solirubrobacteraceae bacterium]
MSRRTDEVGVVRGSPAGSVVAAAEGSCDGERGATPGSVLAGVEADKVPTCGFLGSDAMASGSAAASLEGADDVDVVLFASPRFVDASSVRARCKAGGNSRPCFSARRKIPAAALGLKKNLAGTSSSSTSGNDEDASPPLGHSEVSAVQHSPGEVVKPDVGQRREYEGEVASFVGGK